MARPTDTADVRRHNTALVMRYVADHGPTSRADVRRATGLVSGSVTSIVAELMARNLLVEPGGLVTTGGRPQRLIEVNAVRVLGLVALISRQSVVVDVMDLAGNTVHTVSHDHDGAVQGAAAMVAALAAALDAGWELAHSVAGSWLASSVVVTPGPVTADSVMTDSIELGIRGLDFRRELGPVLRHSHDLVILNNGRLGALAEFQALSDAERPHTMVYLASGPAGVGGGMVVDHHLFRGEHGLAGEVGHIGVDKSGPPCVCGARGCLALYLGTAAMLSRATEGRSSRQMPGADVAVLVELAQAGDAATLVVLKEAGEALASAVATMTNYSDVGVVVLGGELPLLWPWLSDAVTELLTRREQVDPRFNPTVRLARYGNRAPLVGAWVTIRARLLEDPSVVPVISVTNATHPLVMS